MRRLCADGVRLLIRPIGQAGLGCGVMDAAPALAFGSLSQSAR
jgi:hypothetical protein